MLSHNSEQLILVVLQHHSSCRVDLQRHPAAGVIFSRRASSWLHSSPLSSITALLLSREIHCFCFEKKSAPE